MLIANVANMKGFDHDDEIVLHIPWILWKDQNNVSRIYLYLISCICEYMRNTYSYDCLTIGISVPSLFVDLQRVLWQ